MGSHRHPSWILWDKMNAHATLVNSKLKQHSKEPTWNMAYCFASDEDEDYVTQCYMDFTKTENQCSVRAAKKNYISKKEPTRNMAYCFSSDEEDAQDDIDAPLEKSPDKNCEDKSKRTEMCGSTDGCLKTAEDVEG